MSSFYGEHRALQDRFDSRRIADVLEAVIVQAEINDEARAFIESRSFFFLSTVNADGHPTVSHKGGAAGFVRVVDRTTIVFPSYDGNGMFLSMGNIAGDSRIGLLFMDFERPHRIRAQAHATVSHDDPLMATIRAPTSSSAPWSPTCSSTAPATSHRTHPPPCRSTSPTPTARRRYPDGRRSTRCSPSSRHDSRESPRPSTI